MAPRYGKEIVPRNYNAIIGGSAPPSRLDPTRMNEMYSINPTSADGQSVSGSSTNYDSLTVVGCMDRLEVEAMTRGVRSGFRFG